ncbi:hypothetical protein B0H14DRAFT_2607417 [Mycena olivaceomarginata]|nr:hypothetical protein B0H14DRAFT_2607417 [Mycena olivaceomarginata]
MAYPAERADWELACLGSRGRMSSAHSCSPTGSGCVGFGAARRGSTVAFTVVEDKERHQLRRAEGGVCAASGTRGSQRYLAHFTEYRRSAGGEEGASASYPCADALLVVPFTFFPSLSAFLPVEVQLSRVGCTSGGAGEALRVHEHCVAPSVEERGARDDSEEWARGVQKELRTGVEPKVPAAAENEAAISNLMDSTPDLSRASIHLSPWQTAGAGTSCSGTSSPPDPAIIEEGRSPRAQVDWLI